MYWKNVGRDTAAVTVCSFWKVCFGQDQSSSVCPGEHKILENLSGRGRQVHLWSNTGQDRGVSCKCSPSVEAEPGQEHGALVPTQGSVYPTPPLIWAFEIQCLASVKPAYSGQSSELVGRWGWLLQLCSSLLDMPLMLLWLSLWRFCYSLCLHRSPSSTSVARQRKVRLPVQRFLQENQPTEELWL